MHHVLPVCLRTTAAAAALAARFELQAVPAAATKHTCLCREATMSDSVCRQLLLLLLSSVAGVAAAPWPAADGGRLV
jgi:hypothetical protein